MTAPSITPADIETWARVEAAIQGKGLPTPRDDVRRLQTIVSQYAGHHHNCMLAMRLGVPCACGFTTALRLIKGDAA